MKKHKVEGLDWSQMHKSPFHFVDKQFERTLLSPNNHAQVSGIDKAFGKSMQKDQFFNTSNLKCSPKDRRCKENENPNLFKFESPSK